MVSQKLVRRLESNLPIIAKTGVVVIGRNNVFWCLRNEPDKIKALVIAKNTPPEFLYELDNLLKSIDVKIPVIFSQKSNIELGELCGRGHSVSMLAIYDFGTSAFTEEDLYE
jgi:ribosomal protein L30E